MNRITESMLEAKIKELNRRTQHAPDAYTRQANGQLTANVGTYYLECQYGGYSLAQILNHGGAIAQPFGPRTWTKRELWDLIDAYMAGMREQVSA